MNHTVPFKGFMVQVCTRIQTLIHLSDLSIYVRWLRTVCLGKECRNEAGLVSVIEEFTD